MVKGKPLEKRLGRRDFIKGSLLFLGSLAMAGCSILPKPSPKIEVKKEIDVKEESFWRSKRDTFRDRGYVITYSDYEPDNRAYPKYIGVYKKECNGDVWNLLGYIDTSKIKEGSVYGRRIGELYFRIRHKERIDAGYSVTFNEDPMELIVENPCRFR